MRIDLTSLTEKEQGYLVGFYIGDGNIFVDEKQGIYRMRYFLSLHEHNVLATLSKILSKIFKRLREYPGKDNTFIVEVHSKQFLDFIKNIANKDGLYQSDKPVDFLKGLLEGLIDSDGHVQRNYTEITTMNAKLKENILHITQKFGIKSNIRTCVSSISGRSGWRIGFSLKNNLLNPSKWVASPQTAG
jgi:intein-encoded DNA endonuclease-like protein